MSIRHLRVLWEKFDLPKSTKSKNLGQKNRPHKPLVYWTCSAPNIILNTVANM